MWARQHLSSGSGVETETALCRYCHYYLLSTVWVDIVTVYTSTVWVLDIATIYRLCRYLQCPRPVCGVLHPPWWLCHEIKLLIIPPREGWAGRPQTRGWKIVSFMAEQKHSSRSISIENHGWRSGIMKITICPAAPPKPGLRWSF